MVRREGSTERFAALYVTYRDVSPLKSFRAISDTVYEVQAGKTTDRIDVAAGKFRIKR